MKNYIVLMAIALLVPTATYAQENTAQEPDATCLLETPDDVWLSMGLTQDQITEVTGLRTACETDCTMLKGNSKTPVAVTSTLRDYEEKVYKVIGDEKFQQWLKWCTGRPAKG